MSGIRVGARVRDISGHSEVVGLSEPGEGVIVAPEGWTVKWDSPRMGSINWSDDQLELVTPDPSSQAEIERLRAAAVKLLAAIDELQSMTQAERIITGRSDADIRKASNEAIAELRAALSGSKE